MIVFLNVETCKSNMYSFTRIIIVVVEFDFASEKVED